MKIALIIKDLKHFGAQRVVSRISFILKEAGCDVFIVLFSAKEIDYSFTGELIAIDASLRKGILGKIITTIKRTWELGKVKRSYNFDVAISFLDTPNISNILTKGKEKVYVSVRNYKSLEDKGIFNILNKVMIKMLYPKADKVITVSRAILKDLTVKYRVPEDKMSVIYNPYDVDQIYNQSKDELPKEYQNFYNNHRIIITVGRLFHQKGYWNLIKAFAHLKTKCSDIRLVIVGDGDQEKQLLELARSYGIGNDILFTGYQKNPFKFIKNADLYVMTSLFEGFPNALVEAMACGRPVISVDCKSGPREIMYKIPDINCNANEIELADYGILCPAFTDADNWDIGVISENQKTLANAIEILLENKQLYADYSIKAFERVKDFSFDECRNKYLKIIMED